MWAYVDDRSLLTEHLEQVRNAVGDALRCPHSLGLLRLAGERLDDPLEVLADGLGVLGADDLADDGYSSQRRCGVQDMRQVL